MTKSLTEKWKNGTLDFGYYYVKLPNERPQIYHSNYLKSFTAVRDAWRIEIIAPVPSYDKVKEMIDGDKETIRHLKKILPTIKDKVNYDYLATVIEDFENDLKEMECVK